VNNIGSNNDNKNEKKKINIEKDISSKCLIKTKLYDNIKISNAEKIKECEQPG
jgi:hypothetical protein